MEIKEIIIGFIGAGKMAEALIKGIIKGGLTEPERIMVSDIVDARLSFLKDQYGIFPSPSNLELVKKAHIIIIAVKPKDISEVMEEIADLLDSSKLLISIVAGIPIKTIAKRLKKKVPVIRVMPNTPCLIQEGAIALSPGETSDPLHLDLAREIFDSVGKTVIVGEELMDAVTGLSGSGPAYIFLLIEALSDGGVLMGLNREVSLLLACQTLIGSAKLVLETGEHPGKLKDMVTSPGGTTIAGLLALEEGGLRSTIMRAVEAATVRASELGLLTEEK